VAVLEIVNLEGVVSGQLGQRPVAVSEMRVEDGIITAFEASGDADVTIDAVGSVAIPGLIDSHAHVVFGDWTPRQSALGWIDSYMHGGVTMMMSASEVHLPGRPDDREGVKALAVAAQRAFSEFRPGGVKVLAGSVIIEPTLEPEDFPWLAERGVWLAKVGFGAFRSQAEAAPLVRAAQAAGFVVMNHTGGASIPGASTVTAEDVVTLGCDIIGHANGGTTALPDAELPRLFDAPGAIQIVQAGNLRSALRLLQLARDADALDRILIATDTPTGTGVMPLASLGGLTATDAIALATGNNARVLRRREGVLAVGHPADFSLLQAPLGGAFSDPLEGIEHGDIPGIAAVVISGEVRALRSRNAPAPCREVRMIPSDQGRSVLSPIQDSHR
jgi:enamidase